MKQFLLIAVLFSTNVFAKKSKGGVFLEPIVGYSIYTKDNFLSSNISVGHAGTTYGARAGVEFGPVVLGGRFVTTPDTTYSLTVNGNQVNTQEFSFNQTGSETSFISKQSAQSFFGGINVQIPIFSGNLIRSSIKNAKINLDSKIYFCICLNSTLLFWETNNIYLNYYFNF